MASKWTEITLLDNQYLGEFIVDMQRDVAEAIDEEFNSLLEQIPTDKNGIQQGTFEITLKWQGFV